MARYGPEHKVATRRRMIETAGRRIKSDGIDGSGIATLVADAGLTNGAFYGHFASKDDLVAHVVAQDTRSLERRDRRRPRQTRARHLAPRLAHDVGEGIAPPPRSARLGITTKRRPSASKR